MNKNILEKHMSLNSNNRKNHVTNVLKKGLPLVGILALLLTTAGCKKSSDVPKAETIAESKTAEIVTQKQLEKPACQPPVAQQSDLTVEQKNDESITTSLELPPPITTGDPQLPIIKDIDNELREKIMKSICPDAISDPKIDPSKLPIIMQNHK
jgi:hypothetical protein